MKKIEYARMEERETSYWWHLGRLEIIKTYLQHGAKSKKNLKILNVGCGTGGTIALLEKFGTVDNVDISEEAINFMKQKGYTRLTKVDGIKLPFEDASYDIVGAFDVLEHIEEHEDALKEWHRVLKPGGSVVLTVPAHQWLWSGHDESLHHKRRYTKKHLAKAARTAGLTPKKHSYAIAFSLPLVVGFRYLNKMLGRKTTSETSYVNVPNWVNNLFSNILYAEANAHKYTDIPFGTSVVAVLAKDEAAS